MSGTSAEVTAVIGATTAIAPLASPWYSRTMPKSPAIPAAAPHPSADTPSRPGTSSRKAAIIGIAHSCDTTVTEKEWPRTLAAPCTALPPQKSAVPQTRADVPASRIEITTSSYHSIDRKGQCVDRHDDRTGPIHRARRRFPAPRPRHLPLEEINAAVALHVRALRAGRGWSLDELSGRSGVSKGMLVQIEGSPHQPQRRHARPHRGRLRRHRRPPAAARRRPQRAPQRDGRRARAVARRPRRHRPAAARPERPGLRGAVGLALRPAGALRGRGTAARHPEHGARAGRADRGHRRRRRPPGARRTDPGLPGRPGAHLPQRAGLPRPARHDRGDAAGRIRPPAGH